MNINAFLFSIWLTFPLYVLAETPTKEQLLPEEVQLQEVIVQASRTEKRLIELPSAVSVIPATVLSNHEIFNLTQITSVVPNFFMPDYGTQLTSPVYIRGMGSRINAPSIGMYVDGIPYFEKSAFNFEFFDVHQIEILRGPQGTLFGRNSMGGLINITTRSPQHFQGTNVRLSAGNEGLKRMNVSHHHQLSNRLFYSVAASLWQQDGFHTNTTLDSKTDEIHAYGARFKVHYRFSERLTFDFSTNPEFSRQSGYPYAPFNKETLTVGNIVYNQASGYDRLLISNALKTNYQANGWTITNTFSHQYLNDHQKIDQDFGPDSIFFATQRQNQHNFANETLFRSSESSRYRWLFGLFVFSQDMHQAVTIDAYRTPTPRGIQKGQFWMDFDPRNMGVALFHQSDFRLTKELAITAGLRYDYEFSQLNYRYRGTLGAQSVAPIDTLYPSLHEAVILPKLAVSWSPNASINFFMSYATGHKPGGFNTTFELPEHLKFKGETSYNYELGVKAFMFESVFAEGILFYSMLENQQIFRTAPSGRGSYLDNSGLSRNTGVELSVTGKSQFGLEATATYGFTNAQILEYVQNNQLNYNNKTTPYIPQHTFSAQGTQTLHFSGSQWLDRLKIHLAYQQIGELYWNLSNQLKEAAYGRVNAKVSWIKGNIQLDVWGKNLTNTSYRAFVFEVGSAAFAQAGKPRQWGVSFIWKGL